MSLSDAFNRAAVESTTRAIVNTLPNEQGRLERKAALVWIPVTEKHEGGLDATIRANVVDTINANVRDGVPWSDITASKLVGRGDYPFTVYGYHRASGASRVMPDGHMGAWDWVLEG